MPSSNQNETTDHRRELKPRTDLHTHFAAILPAEKLMELALAHDLPLDRQTAIKLKLFDEGFVQESIPVRSLNEQQRTVLTQAMKLNPDRQSVFHDLDAAYAHRAFITKNPAMFKTLLEESARAYQAQGVVYAEPSFAGIISNPELIRTMHQELPRIEAETGVKLRFLAALWRHSDIEWNLDEADRLMQVLLSPYVVGIDIMGHEKNSIRDLKEPITKIVQWAARNKPGFVARTHAGENPYFSADPSTIDEYNINNAYESVTMMDEARRDEPGGAMTAPYGDQVQLRMGHGRFGLQDATLDLIKRTNTIPEICLTSNRLLNHIDDYSSGENSPFNRYERKGIPFVIGSDGFGMYSTSLPEEAQKAVKAGISEKAIQNLNALEDFILEQDEKRFAIQSKTWSEYELVCQGYGVDPFDELKNVVYTTPDGKPRHSTAVSVKKQFARISRYQTLTKSLNELGINTDMSEIQKVMEGKQLIGESGASRGSWPRIPPHEQQLVEDTMREQIAHVDGTTHIYATGGTDFGYEAVIHRLIEERNAQLPADRKISVIGAITMEANVQQIRPGTIDHVIILRNGDSYAECWMEQPEAFLNFIQENKGCSILVGGGQAIRDMVLDGDSRGMLNSGQMVLMDGVTGASSEKAVFYPQSVFTDAAKLIEMLGKARSKLQGDFANAHDFSTGAPLQAVAIQGMQDLAQTTRQPQ